MKSEIRRIDLDALDEELRMQPERFRKAGLTHSAAVSERDVLDEARKKVKAELTLETEGRVADIAARVEQDDRYQKALHKYLEAKHAADDAWVGRETLQQRAAVLKDLAKLWVGGYFGADSVVRGSCSREVRQQAYESNRQALADQRRNKTKRDRL